MRFLRYCLLVLFVFTSYSTYSNFFGWGIGIHETSHIHPNGMGRFEIAIDLSEATQLIQIATLFTKATPETIQKSIQETCAAAAKSLEGIPGISNVATAHSVPIQHAKLSFQFHRIEALNEAFSKLYAHIDHPGVTHFKMNRHTFTRRDKPSLTQLMAHYDKVFDAQNEGIILKTMINATTYNITYRFDRQIKKATNKLANVSENRLMVSLKQPLGDAREEEASLSNTVTF